MGCELTCLAIAVLCAAGAFGELLPVEIYEKGGGDVDCSARYSIAELVRDTGVKSGDFILYRRLVRVTNPSNETRVFQAVVRAVSDFVPSNWVIPGVIYGDCAFGNQVSPSGLERDGEPWVFGYDRTPIPSCTLSETKDALFAMFASDRDSASLESACSLKRLPDGRLEHRIFYPIRESPVCYAFKFSYVERYDEWITPLTKYDAYSVTYRTNMQPQYVDRSRILGTTSYRFWPTSRMGVPGHTGFKADTYKNKW